MAICLQADVNGVLSVMTPQPSDITTCAYVVASGSEFGNEPWNLTIEQGHEIGMYILLACAIAWGWRYIGRHIDDEPVKE